MAGESMICLQAWADSDDRDSGTRKRRCRPGEHLQEGKRAAKRRDLGTRHQAPAGCGRGSLYDLPGGVDSTGQSVNPDERNPMTGTFTVRGVKIRCGSQRRYVVVCVSRPFTGTHYGDFSRAEIWKRTDMLRTARVLVERQGFHQSRAYVVVDTHTGEEV